MEVVLANKLYIIVGCGYDKGEGASGGMVEYSGKGNL